MSLVQPIAVVPTAHFDTVAAVAIASTLAAASADLDSPSSNWHAWLERAFTKSVRRTRRAADVLRVRALCDETLDASSFQVGESTAWAFPPMRYEAFPKDLSRLQVSGLDLPRDRTEHDVDPDAPERPEVLISRDVAMTTGKTAAQVAHGLMVWMLLLREQSPERLAGWAERPGLRVRVADLDELPADPSESITIRDSGLTEITPNSATVRVLRPTSVFQPMTTEEKRLP